MLSRTVTRPPLKALLNEVVTVRDALLADATTGKLVPPVEPPKRAHPQAAKLAIEQHCLKSGWRYVCVMALTLR